ncbi:piggyBac transposable element-derived protein 4-like, partial [Sipha flava]|uniref:PiggyBac transposable element-derived protein 4-like n=1 Tax=Sipha flava TaxID=143950 RepID=A0A8B8F918_9HEMI
MNPEQINEILNYSSDSDIDEDDYSSSEEYLPPGNESESEHSDGNSVENGIDFENSEWNFDINTEPEFVDFTGIPGLRWHDIDVDELKKLLGLSIVMGYLKFPSLGTYWSKFELDFHPIFEKTMSRHRYELILRFLCFYDPRSADTSDRLHKIENVTKHVINNIQTKYYPKQNLSLDESMMLWRGRLSFRQYIPSKAHKYGIKFYELCSSDGFLLNFIIYKGKGTVIDENGVTFGIVTKLMQNYLGKGHTLYMDNFYNSVQLVQHLYNNKITVVGTLRKNRKDNPKEVLNSKLNKGEVSHAQKGNIHVIKWRNMRDVSMISSKHKLDFENVIDKFGRSKFKPNMVVDYNSKMSGIDRIDQMISYYPIPRKSMR